MQSAITRFMKIPGHITKVYRGKSYFNYQKGSVVRRLFNHSRFFQKERNGANVMNDINALTQVDYIAVFISVMTILIGVLSIKKIIESFYKWFGLETKWMREKREQRDLLLKTAEKVCDLEGRQDEFAQNRIHDREQSFQIQKELVDAIDRIDHKLDVTHEKTNKRVRAELKERIGQSYRYYHSKGQWNDIEKEALEGLIEEYEEAGGNNSFVHDIVVPESYTWKLVDRE